LSLNEAHETAVSIRQDAQGVDIDPVAVIPLDHMRPGGHDTRPAMQPSIGRRCAAPSSFLVRSWAPPPRSICWYGDGRGAPEPGLPRI